MARAAFQATPDFKGIKTEISCIADISMSFRPPLISKGLRPASWYSLVFTLWFQATPDFKGIKTLKKRLARIKLSLRRLTMLERKADTRRKIQLGGLVIKSGIADFPPAVILGALSFALRRTKDTNGAYVIERFRREGDRLFSGDA